MKRIRYYSLIGLMCFVLFSACSTEKEIPKVPDTGGSRKGIARVKNVEVLQLASQEVQVRVAASLEMPDTCTYIDKIDVQQKGNAFRITVTTTREADQICSNSKVEIDRLIPLEVKDLSPGLYHVVVNDSSTSFQLAGSAQPNAVEPASVSTEQPLNANPTEVAASSISGNQSQPESTAGEDSSSSSAEPQDGEQSRGAVTAGQDQPASNEGSETETLGEAGVSQSQPGVEPSISDNSQPCEEKVGFFGDVTIPDDTFFRKGETFTKIWKLRNEGTCTWGPGYSLVFASGEILNAPLTIPLQETITPSTIFEISVDMAAPAQGGTYISRWLLQNPQGKRFGMGASRQDVIYARIVVGWIDPAESASEGSGEEASGKPALGADCAIQNNPAFEQEILGYINNERMSRGLRALKLEERLTQAARMHSADMACNNFTDHTGSDGSSMKTRTERQGYTFRYVAENIFYGDLPEEAFKWWMGSQVHKDNILNSNATEIGIGYVFYQDSRYGRYYTLVFARP